MPYKEIFPPVMNVLEKVCNKCDYKIFEHTKK